MTRVSKLSLQCLSNHTNPSFSTLFTLESVPSFTSADKNWGAPWRRSTTIFKKRHSPRTSFNLKTDLDTVLYQTSFQGYRQFISVYITSHNSPQTLKIWLGFQSFPFNLCQITLTRSTEPLLASLGNPKKAALDCRKNKKFLCLTCLTDS